MALFLKMSFLLSASEVESTKAAQNPESSNE